MPFPDERDRNIIRRAEQVENLATDLCDWLSEFNADRRDRTCCRSTRATSSRSCSFAAWRAASTPRPRCRWPPRPTGPRRWARASSWARCSARTASTTAPSAATRTLGEPAYYKDLSFDNDLNPQCGSQEATALVTRFTTKDRIGASVSPQYPVMVRALTRAEWLRVLARGFHAECKTPAATWQQSRAGRRFSRSWPASIPASEVDRKWRMDLLDAFSYMRNVDRRGFQAKEAVINGLLSRYPLSEEGYVAAAAALFWDNWPSLTDLFIRINNFLNRITLGNHDPAIFCHWAGVRFLLGQPAVEGLRAAHLEVLQPRRLERHPPHAARTSISCWSTARAPATAPRNWKPSRPACWNW